MLVCVGLTLFIFNYLVIVYTSEIGGKYLQSFYSFIKKMENGNISEFLF